MLTIVIPTRNRPHHCAALVRFLIDCGIRHPIVVADSSNCDSAAMLQSSCAGLATLQRFPSGTSVIDKMRATVATVASPYVAMLPDDDVTFPHALEASLAHLAENPDVAAAQGHQFDYGIAGDIFDIVRLRWYTPTIAAEDPLQRMCDLMRRYQPFMWAVFRTEVLSAALAVAGRQHLVGMQELAAMLVAVFQGKVTWLPHIYLLRGMEPSMTQPYQSNPIVSFIEESEWFFFAYRRYRHELVRFYRERINPQETRPIGRLIDLSVAAFLIPGMYPDVMHQQAQLFLGHPGPPIDTSIQGYCWREPVAGDVLRVSSRKDRRYLWRHDLPWAALQIGDAEIIRVEEQLDRYILSTAGTS
jgi:glycosyltransferase domain-containing protein